MQLIYFNASRSDHSEDERHAELTAEMARVAAEVEGFVEWRDTNDDLDYWGLVMFTDEEGPVRWKQHPGYAGIEAEIKKGLYTTFGTKVFEIVRQAQH